MVVQTEESNSQAAVQGHSPGNHGRYFREIYAGRLARYGFAR